jgi:hypothetical protein
VGLDGGAARACGGAREGARCLTGRSIAGRADYTGETLEHVFHAREGAGKRERPAAGPCGNGVGRSCVCWCGEGLGVVEEETTVRVENFSFFKAGPLHR